MEKIKTGLPEIDERTEGGLQLGTTGVILGRPISGKTTMLFKLAWGAMHEGHDVLMYGGERYLRYMLEMPSGEGVGRFDKVYLGYDSFERLEQSLIQYRDRNGRFPKLLLVDDAYLFINDPAKFREQNPEYEAGDISQMYVWFLKKLDTLSNLTGVGIWAFLQMNRSHIRQAGHGEFTLPDIPQDHGVTRFGPTIVGFNVRWLPDPKMKRHLTVFIRRHYEAEKQART